MKKKNVFLIMLTIMVCVIFYPTKNVDASTTYDRYYDALTACNWGTYAAIPDISSYDYVIVETSPQMGGTSHPDIFIFARDTKQYTYVYGAPLMKLQASVTPSYTWRLLWNPGTSNYMYYNYGSTTSEMDVPATIIFCNQNVYRENALNSDIPGNILIQSKTGDDLSNEPPQQPVNIPLSYIQMALYRQYPYYIMVQVNPSLKYFIASAKQFYADDPNNYIHRSNDAIYFTSYDNGSTWSMFQICGGNTKLIGAITPVNVQYNNYGIYKTYVDDGNTLVKNVTDNANQTVIKTAESIDDLDEYCILYTYEYDASIEKVENMLMQNQALYRSGWGLVIGESKSKYDITWNSPTTAGYYLEIQVQSSFEDETRRWFKQSYHVPWTGYGNPWIMPEDEKMSIDINTLGKILLDQVWNDKDTGSWISIPPTRLYFRYVIADNEEAKLKYGCWTRLDMKGGSQGIIEAVKDNVTTNETKNQDGTIEYEDIPIDGNQTEYIDTGLGKEVDESQSFTGAVDSVDNALDSSTQAIKNVAGWVGQLPGLIANLFGFIPTEIIDFIELSIIVLMILKIAGR